MKRNVIQKTATMTKVWRFAASVAGGILSLFVVGGLGSFVMFGITAVMVALFWFLGSAVLAGLLSRTQPEVRAIWNIGYALPIFLWGVAFICMSPKELGAPLWFGLSTVTLFCAITGVWFGRRFSRTGIDPKDRILTAPVEY